MIRPLLGGLKERIMEKLLEICTCDDIGDSPCPRHQKEICLQEKLDMTLDPKVFETVTLKRLSETQLLLAKAVELLLECKPLIEENEDDFTSTAPDIRDFIKNYTK